MKCVTSEHCLVLQGEFQVHLMLNIRAFVLGEGGEKRKGSQLYSHFSPFLLCRDKKGTGPEIFVCPASFKAANKSVKHFRFSFQVVLPNPGESICSEECTAL